MIDDGFRGSVFTQRTAQGVDYCDIEDGHGQPKGRHTRTNKGKGGGGPRTRLDAGGPRPLSALDRPDER